MSFLIKEEKEKPTNSSGLQQTTSVSSDEASASKTKFRTRGQKRKRRGSDSSSDGDNILPENALEMEKNLHASAIKNNLDDVSVRKILKKVVTNDHVLALVKLREEEEDSGAEDKSVRPKLTRSKVKELMKDAPKSASWNLELTPIKHIPVKTRPEVKALIAQELQEDEDDEEYEPTHDDVPSDDDHLESCSDLDSQPRTPATPRNSAASPRVVRDGPFIVPQELSTPTRKRKDLDEEEATIALRTRSKLSLSETSIEHIENNFFPPDDIPPAVDDLWNQFLTECLDPTPASKNEDDDEADPEYNVAADPDAIDEDEEALEKSILKISKKELNDLVTELFSVMPFPSEDDNLELPMADNALKDQAQEEASTKGLAQTQWEGKQEPISEGDPTEKQPPQQLLSENDKTRFSIGKTEPEEPSNHTEEAMEVETLSENVSTNNTNKQIEGGKETSLVSITVKEHNLVIQPLVQKTIEPPPSLKRLQAMETTTQHEVQVQVSNLVLTEQVQILQQQLRQHIQLSTSNFLQLYVHPVHWLLAPKYKEYLETLYKIAEKNPNSVANVCNLKPAMKLVQDWESDVAKDTPENKEMVNFVQAEVDRSRRRYANNGFYVGEFHERLLRVIACSPVFLYPYLLPSMPYRGDTGKKSSYSHSEDQLLALGLDQFSRYIEINPELFRPNKRLHPRHRWGLTLTLQLIEGNMFPWLTVKSLRSHVTHVRRIGDKDNPIVKYFEDGEVKPVQHQLLSFNPNITLYEQPEHEMPRIWQRYLAKTSKRFKRYCYKRTATTGFAPTGVPVDVPSVEPLLKKPLPADFIKQIPGPYRLAAKSDIADNLTPQSNTQNQEQNQTHLYQVIAANGSEIVVVPLNVQTTITNTTDSAEGPIIISSICSTQADSAQRKMNKEKNHCKCCILLQKICKEKQTLITDYFGPVVTEKKRCYCSKVIYQRITNGLRLLLSYYGSKVANAFRELEAKIENDAHNERCKRVNEIDMLNNETADADELAFATSFYYKLLVRTSMVRKAYMKIQIYKLFSTFDQEGGDPVELARNLNRIVGTEMFDVYLDFLPMLTPEQADRIGNFKNYFTRRCIKNMIRKIEEQVQDKNKQKLIFKQLHNLYFDRKATACDICCGLLEIMDGLPTLAQYTFSLFPHRRKENVSFLSSSTLVNIIQLNEVQDIACDNNYKQDAQRPSTAKDHTRHNPSNENHHNITKPIQVEPNPSEKNVKLNENIESDNRDNIDHVNDDIIDDVNNDNMDDVNDDNIDDVNYDNVEDENYDKTNNENYDNVNDENIDVIIKEENVSSPESDPGMRGNMNDLYMSPAILSIVTTEDELSEEEIKTEFPEWKRDEDKLILEVLKRHLTTEKSKGKTMIEIAQEGVFQMISETLSDKSEDDVRQRIIYLLEMLVSRQT